MKAPLQFRARKFDPSGKGAGPFSIEASRNGVDWSPGLAGLDVEDVERAMTKLHKAGVKIVDTEDFQFKP